MALTISQLTKEEEGGSEDMEVRREDQEKINRFSSLHQKETALEEELRGKIVSTARNHVGRKEAMLEMGGAGGQWGMGSCLRMLANVYGVICRRRRKIWRRFRRSWSWLMRRRKFRKYSLFLPNTIAWIIEICILTLFAQIQGRRLFRLVATARGA